MQQSMSNALQGAEGASQKRNPAQFSRYWTETNQRNKLKIKSPGSSRGLARAAKLGDQAAANSELYRRLR